MEMPVALTKAVVLLSSSKLPYSLSFRSVSSGHVSRLIALRTDSELAHFHSTFASVTRDNSMFCTPKQTCVVQPGECEWLLVSDVTTRVKWRCLHYFRRGELVKARNEVSGADRSLAFTRRWRMCSSVFRSTRSRSFVLMRTFFFFFSFVDRQNIYSCKSDLFANFSAGYIFFCALWMWMFLSFYFSQL